MLPQDWAFWLANFRAHESCIGWPSVAAASQTADETPSEQRLKTA
jgi:hypothetical protein